MAKALKQMMVSEYEQALEGLDGLVIFDPGAMTVESTQAFRQDLREKAGGAQMQLIHNRTARIALRRTLYSGAPEVLDDVLKGPSAIVYGGDGPIPIAKVLREWRRKFRDLKLKGAVAGGEVLKGDEVEGLADLPGMPQLRAMMLSAILGSARGIAGSLQAVYGGIVRALNAHVDQMGGGETSAEAAEGGDGGSGAT